MMSLGFTTRNESPNGLLRNHRLIVLIIRSNSSFQLRLSLQRGGGIPYPNPGLKQVRVESENSSK